jgi:hypothetical protein
MDGGGGEAVTVTLFVVVELLAPLSSLTVSETE